MNIKKCFKENIGELLLFVIITAATLLPLAITGCINFDCDEMMTHPERAMETIKVSGRYSLLFLKRIFGLESYRPVLSAVLFIVFFEISIILVGCYIKCAKRDLLLFGLLIGTSPVWAYTLYFNHQIAEIGAGILILTLCALIFDHVLIRRYGSAPAKASVTGAGIIGFINLAVVFCIFIYQALIVYYIVILGIVTLTGYERDLSECGKEKSRRISRRKIFVLIINFVITMFIYLIIKRSASTGVLRTDEMIKWGVYPAGKCISNIIIEFGKIMLCYGSGNASLYIFDVAMMILIAVNEYRSAKAKGDRYKPDGIRLICIILLLAAPLFMTALLGDRPVRRMQYALQIVSAYLAVYAIGKLPERKKLISVVCTAWIVIQILLCTRLVYTNHMRDAKDARITDEIVNNLTALAACDKPVIFIGREEFEDNSILLEKYDVYGLSFYEWVYNEGNPYSAAQSAIRYIECSTGVVLTLDENAEHRMEALTISESMPAYPDKGFMAYMGDYTIINLGR